MFRVGGEFVCISFDASGKIYSRGLGFGSFAEVGMSAQLELPMSVEAVRQSPESETAYRAIVRLRRSGYSVHRAGCDHVVKKRGGKRVQLLSKIHLLLLSGAISRAEP